jgi:hypothetical protein
MRSQIGINRELSGPLSLGEGGLILCGGRE